eukprot:gene25422-biopygen22493
MAVAVAAGSRCRGLQTPDRVAAAHPAYPRRRAKKTTLPACGRCPVSVSVPLSSIARTCVRPAYAFVSPKQDVFTERRTLRFDRRWGGVPAGGGAVHKRGGAIVMSPPVALKHQSRQCPPRAPGAGGRRAPGAGRRARHCAGRRAPGAGRWALRGAGVARAISHFWLGVARAWRGHDAGVARAFPVPPAATRRAASF